MWLSLAQCQSDHNCVEGLNRKFSRWLRLLRLLVMTVQRKHKIYIGLELTFVLPDDERSVDSFLILLAQQTDRLEKFSLVQVAVDHEPG